MIIGTGDIASALNDRQGALFFASGVSNSSCNEYRQFNRERELLEVQRRDLCLFYFSTISIYTVTSPYTTHKRKMENFVRMAFKNYNIIRIGNIDWGKNPNTFLNYLRAKKAADEPYMVRDEYKYMVSRKQLQLVTDHLPLTGPNEINIFGDMKKVIDLI
jgi:UDP-2-acetamido-2,6-beta-L-arabino-hexul-4-ose reductase